jgi:hypothetical protein
MVSNIGKKIPFECFGIGFIGIADSSPALLTA